MSWLAVARNDLRAARRSRTVWLLPTLSVLGFGGLAYALVELGAPDFEVFLAAVAAGVAVLLPLAGVLFGYRTVIRERESGRIVLLMSLPNSRAELVVGKLLSRAAVLAGSLSVGALAAAALLVFEFAGFAPGRFALLLGLAFCYGLVFVGLATALSMAMATSRRVVAAALGLVLLMLTLWNQVVAAVVMVLFRFDPGALAPPPVWAQSLQFANPRTLFTYLLAELVDVGLGPAGISLDGQWFDSPAVALLLLLGWLALPLLVGYTRFERAEF